MTVLRRMAAALAIVAGVLTLLVWAAAFFAVRTVEDGTLVKNLTTAALDNPAVEKLVVGKAQDAVGDSFKNQGLDLERYGVDDAVDEIVAALVRSEAFSDLIATAVESTHADLTRQLTEDSRQEAPLALNIDMSLIVNEGLADAPVIGDLVTDVSVAPISIEVVDGPTFERVRNVYSWVDRLAMWAGWLGAALILAGILLTPNKRWFFPKLLFWVGGLGIVAWIVVSLVDVEKAAGVLPGGSEGDLGSTVAEVVPQQTIDDIAGRILLFAIVALAVAAALSVLIEAVGKKGRGDRRHAADGPAHAA